MPTAGLAQWMAWAAIAACWELIPWLGVPSSVLPSFSTVVIRMSQVLLVPEILGEFGLTFGLVFIAFTISLSAGIPLGLFVGRNAFLEAVSDPFVSTMYSTPKAVFLPVFVLVFGFGTTNKIVYGIFMGIFAILMTTVAGIRQVDPRLVAKAKALGASPRQLYAKVLLPSIIPTIFTGVRIGLNFTILGVILAEMLSPQNGIGWLLHLARETLNTRDLLAFILLTSVVTILLNQALFGVEERLSRWRGIAAVRV